MTARETEYVLRMLWKYPTAGPILNDKVEVIGFSFCNYQYQFDLDGNRMSWREEFMRKYMGMK